MAFTNNNTTALIILAVCLIFSGCFAAKNVSVAPPESKPPPKPNCQTTCAECHTIQQCTRSKAKCTWQDTGGCAAIPKCTLPNPMPDGYVASGTGCSGSRIAAECTGLSCNGPTYTGTVTVSCTTNGGIFTLAGCSPVVVWHCSLPNSLPVGFVYDGVSCENLQTVETCGGLSCAMPWFEGTVSVMCITANGLFSLSGCDGGTSVCGPGWVSGTSGTLDTGFGTNNYADNTKCARVIEVPSGNAISVSFSALCMETCCDFVSLHDGRSLADPLVGGALLSGCEPPTSPLVTSQNALMVVFTSDVSAANTGFRLTWSAVPVPVQCTRPTSLPAEYQYGGTGCEGLRTAESCLGFSCMSPNVGTVDVSCPSQGGTFQVAGCGPESSICTNVVSSAFVGSLTDGFAIPYPEHQFCDRLIQAPPRHMISVAFQSFCTELDFDLVTLMDGSDQTSPVIASLSGCEGLPGPFHTSQNMLLVRFTSDRSNGNSGFDMSWASLPIGICDVAPSDVPTGVMDDGSGSGADYANNKDCTRVLQAPIGKRVRVTFSELCTEAPDLVVLYDGSSSSDTVIMEQSGCGVLPPEASSFESSGNAMTVRFVSDGSGTAAGFTLTWQFFEPM